MRVRSVVVVLVCCDCHSLATTTTTPKAAAAAFSSNHNNSNLWRGGGGGEGDWLSAAKRKVRQYSTAGGLGGSGATTAWRAYELRKSELNLHPDDPLLQLETAEALLKWIRHTTNGNFPKAASGEVCEGDSPSSRKVWRKYAPEALRLLKGGAAHALEGEAYDVAKYQFLQAEASTYLSSAKGILRAALQADAITFKRNVRPLIDDHPTYQGGVGHTFMGAFYLAAPWPVRDLGKAQVHFDAALKIDPRSRRNHYCRGLVALGSRDAAKAKSSFRQALKCKATSPEEEDVSDFFQKESQEALKALESPKGVGGQQRAAVVSTLAVDY